MSAERDFNRPFHEKYLAAADAMERLGVALMLIGMSGNTDFQRLQAEFIKHGAVTHRDIQRETMNRAGSEASQLAAVNPDFGR